MNTVEIIFSPTGGTEKVANIIRRQWSESTVKIDLSDPEGPFRRQSATLVAYLVEHNEVRELEINDLERLDLAEWWFYKRL